VLFGDRELAGTTARVFEENPVGAAWEATVPALRAFERADPFLEGLIVLFEALTSARVAPRQRALMHAIGAEIFACFGQNERAIEQVEAVNAAGSIDVLWFDRARPLAPLRNEQRWLEARAQVAGRAAALFG
jgi:hypothetical protein